MTQIIGKDIEMTTNVKSSGKKGWLGVIIATVCGVLFLGFLFLSMQHDTRNVNEYAKTWSGDGQSASEPMNMDHMSMQHDHNMSEMKHDKN